MNEKLVSIFKDLAVYEDSLKRPFPAKAYRNAVKIFSELQEEVTNAEQIKGIPGIGDGIFKKVDLFLKEGTFPRLQEYLQSDIAKCKEIASVKGIGINKAKLLFNAGIHSLAELKEAVKDLKVGDKIAGVLNYTQAIKVGLEYEAHTEKTRMTVEEHDAVANPMLLRISEFGKEREGFLKCEAVGSRRRYDGSEGYTIGDIDIIIGDSSPDESFQKFLEGLLDEVVMSGPTKVSGVKDRRQVDFRIVKPEQYGALLLHATGPMEWNVALRKIAISKGMTLNEYGLFSSDRCIAADTEESILGALGVEVVAPWKRKEAAKKV